VTKRPDLIGRHVARIATDEVFAGLVRLITRSARRS
jgi:hypothetical protein